MTKTSVLIAFSVLLVPDKIMSALIALFGVVILRNKSRPYTLVILSCSLILAGVNTTKSLESDFATYFLISERLIDATIGEVLSRYGHEPAYYLLNWIHVSVLGQSWESWVFIFSFFIYFIFLLAVQRTVECLGLARGTGIGILLLAGFSPVIFAQSAHLVRQYLAGSFVALAIANSLFGKRMLPFFLVAPLFHISAALFLLLPSIFALSMRFRLIGGLFAFIIPPVSIMVLKLAAMGGLGEESFLPLQYGLSRLGQDSYHRLDDLSVVAILFMSISLIMSLAVFSGRLRCHGRIQAGLSARVCTIFAFLSVFSGGVLLLAAARETEIAVRFMQYIVLLFPIILAFFSTDRPGIQNVILAVGFVMPLAIFLYPIPWTYTLLDKLGLF